MNSVFNAVPNPQEEWSASTRVASEWEFGLTVLTPADDFGPLKMRYLDYPGLILTAPRAAEDERYRQVIEQLKSANPRSKGSGVGGHGADHERGLGGLPHRRCQQKVALGLYRERRADLWEEDKPQVAGSRLGSRR